MSLGMTLELKEDLNKLAEVKIVLKYVPPTTSERMIVPEPINNASPPSQWNKQMNGKLVQLYIPMKTISSTVDRRQHHHKDTPAFSPFHGAGLATNDD